MSNVVHIITRRPLDERLGTSVRAGECLACFLHRMVGDQSCLGSFAWTEHYRQVRARRAAALVRRLEAAGAVCDCEVVTQVWRLSPGLWVRDAETGAFVEPSVLPECAGVRPTSTQSCSNWVPAHRIAL